MNAKPQRWSVSAMSANTQPTPTNGRKMKRPAAAEFKRPAAAQRPRGATRSRHNNTVTEQHVPTEVAHDNTETAANTAAPQNVLHEFLSERAEHAIQQIETARAGDLDNAIAQLRDRDEGAAMFLNPMLPCNANQSEISKEIWLSTPQHRLDEFLPLWDARGGVPIRVATLCSGADTPMHAMRNQTYHWNTALENSFEDAAQPTSYHHILSCDIKLTARRFIYANSPCPLIFHRICKMSAS